MTGSARVLRIRPLETDMTKDEPNNIQLIALMAAGLVPVHLIARLLGLWLPEPFAQAISVFAWMFGAYWIPPRPKIRLWAWLIIVVLVSATILLLHAMGVDPF
jgi:hypothetical protein